LRIASLIATLLLLGLLFVGAHWSGGRHEAAPAVTFQLIDGRRLKIAELLGRPVLVNFWSTGCAQCIGEMPWLTDLYRRLSPSGLEIIGVAMSFDRPDHVLEVSRREALPYPISLDLTGELSRAFGGILATPTSILVDARGMMVLRRVGPLDRARLEARIEQLL
jgi:peroxiredoxin